MPLLAKLQRSLSTRGVAGTMRIAVQYALAPVAPYYPTRILGRMGDRVWDWRHGVDTLAVDLDRLRIDEPTVKYGNRYQGTRPGRFTAILRHLPVRHEDFLFVDIGSGKGRALLLASAYPWRRIIGVEFAPELVEIARRNCRTYRNGLQKCRDITSVCADATKYELPPEPVVIYVYNPFQENLVRAFVANVERSIERHPRRLYLIYANPQYREVVDAACRLRRVAEGKDFCLYESIQD